MTIRNLKSFSDDLADEENPDFSAPDDNNPDLDSEDFEDVEEEEEEGEGFE